MASAWDDRVTTVGNGARLAVVVLACTLVLTAMFVGVLSVSTGGMAGISERLPFYVLAMGVIFVAAIVGLDGEIREPLAVLRMAVAAGGFGFAGILLSGEGVTYMANNSGQLLTSQLLFYFVAAGLVGTGLAYWAIQNWRDVVDRREPGF